MSIDFELFYQSHQRSYKFLIWFQPMFEMVITVDPIIQGVPNVGTSLHTTQGGHYPNIPSSVEYKTDLCEKYNQLISNSSFEHDINLFVYFIYQIYVFKQIYLGVICLIIDAFIL